MSRTTRPSETAGSQSVDRSERPSHLGLLLGLAGILIMAFAGLALLSQDSAQPIVLGLLALLAMAGIFFVFALSVGAVRFSGRGARNDLTRAIADTAEEGLVAVEEPGRVLYANQRYLQLAGAAGSELRTVERLVTGSPEISEAVYRLAQAARERRSAVEEVRLTPGLDGVRDFGWYRLRVRPLTGARGPGIVLWSVADVTHDRERQENVFQELQQAIDYLDHAPAGFLSVEAGGAIVYMNATLASWLDHDLAKVGSGGLTLGEIVPRESVAFLVPGAGTPGQSVTETFDLDLRRRGGGALPVRIHHRVVFGPDGRPGASRTLVLARPTADAGRDGAADMRFDRFFNAMPLALATLDEAGRVLKANAAFYRIFGGRPAGEGSGAAAPDLVAGPDRAEFAAALAASRSAGTPSPALDVGLTVDASRSARIWLSPAGEAGQGARERTVLYALDTTEQRQLEQRFAQAHKMQAVGQLAGGVAHDFNNVLQAIIGYSDLLLASHRPTDPAFQDIMQIKQNANRAAGLVRQLLAFSRRQTLRPEVVKLGDTLSDLTLLLKRLLGERIQLDQRQGRDLWFVKADVNQLEQVVMNLAVNARDAMPDGGTVSIATENIAAEEARRLDLTGMPADDYVRIVVSDTGTGIAPEVMDQIFEPFFTTKELGKGTGLGLSTVFGIVKQSGGFIYVDSTVGEGTTFSIYLPRFIPEPETEPKPEIVVEKRVADMTGQGTILLVEDEDAVRAVNGRALTARGYTVLEAASGFEALALIDEHGGRIDLAVSDVMMPEMDGPTLLGEMRKRVPGLKVVFVSGYAEDAFAKHLPEGETFKFLPKPFSLKQLVETVKDAIKGE